MKIMVCGSGIIGSLLIHTLAAAGNDITVLARGKRLEELNSVGLRTRAHGKKEIMTDKVRAVDRIPTDEHFDIIFSPMQCSQQLELLDSFAAADCDAVVLIGNNVYAPEMQERILSGSAKPKTILFGFQGTGGSRYDDHIETVSVGSVGMTIGGLDSEASPEAKALIEKAFSGAEYRLTWEDNMNAWYICHIAFVIPICYLCYQCGCDLRKSNGRQRKLCLDAADCAFKAVKAAGIEIRPIGEDSYYSGGVKRLMMNIMMYFMCKTSIGDYAASNHCKHAAAEMAELSKTLEDIMNSSGADLTIYNKLKSGAPSWQELCQKWC